MSQIWIFTDLLRCDGADRLRNAAAEDIVPPKFVRPLAFRPSPQTLQNDKVAGQIGRIQVQIPTGNQDAFRLFNFSNLYVDWIPSELSGCTSDQQQGSSTVDRLGEAEKMQASLRKSVRQNPSLNLPG